eukprot:COSAG02_NODE_48094_length_336_cov_0.860759_1_plen_72_part_10
MATADAISMVFAKQVLSLLAPSKHRTVKKHVRAQAIARTSLSMKRLASRLVHALFLPKRHCKNVSPREVRGD